MRCAAGFPAIALLLGCSGSIDRADSSGGNGQGSGGDNAGGDAGGKGQGTGGSGTLGEIVDLPLTCTPHAPGQAVPLRRLTRAEYRNSIADLFTGSAMPTIDLPSDPVAGGLENNAAALLPTQVHVDQWNDAGKAIAAAAADGLRKQAACSGTDGSGCLKWIGRRIFRRALSDAEATAFGTFFSSTPGVADFRSSLQLTVQAMLDAPQFLYRLETASGNRVDAYSTASRLSFLLWQSTPDDTLLDAAQGGKLSSDADIATQVDRMLMDPRAKRTFLDISRQWMDLDRLDSSNTVKLDADRFTAAVRASMHEESNRFLGDLIWGASGNLDTLLTGNDTYVDANLAPLYGVQSPASGWARVALDNSKRAGFLTQTSFLTSQAHSLSPSPVLRGVFILRRLLCTDLGSPPPGVDQTPPEPTGQITNRQGYTARTEVGTCNACHSLINPLGFTLENYDTMGRFRTMDNGQSVDATANVFDQDVDGGVGMARMLAGRAEVSQCVASHFVRYAMALGSGEDDPCMRVKAAAALKGSGGFRQMLVDIAKQPAFNILIGGNP